MTWFNTGRCIATVLLLALLVVACTNTAPQANVASSVTTVQPTTSQQLSPTLQPIDARLQGIQQTLDRYAQAYNEHNRALLQQTLDPQNSSVRRVMLSRFDEVQASFTGSVSPAMFHVTQVRDRSFGFVEAHIVDGNGNVVDWLLRQHADQWVFSEPSIEQLGTREQIETAHFVLFSYPWSQDITMQIGDLLEQARDRVQRRLGRVPDTKVNVYLHPIAALPPIDIGLASYNRGGRGSMRIDITSPQSLTYPFYKPNHGWEGILKSDMVHEYTHLVTDRCFISLDRMSDWMVEGLAMFIAEQQKDVLLHDAVQSNHIIPIIDTQSALKNQDLQHMSTFENDSLLAYNLSYSLIAYIVERYGGLDGFWKLATAYSTSQSLDAALQQTFGITYVQFADGWQKWLHNHY